MIRRRKADLEAYQANPETWDGSESDPFWAEQRAIQNQMRGR